MKKNVIDLFVKHFVEDLLFEETLEGTHERITEETTTTYQNYLVCYVQERILRP